MVGRMTSSVDKEDGMLNGHDSGGTTRNGSAAASIDVVCIGETLLDLLPSRTGRRLRDASSFNPSLGGSPANTSVWLSRLGVRSALVTRIGDDEFGAICMRELQDAGVDTRGVQQDPKLKTGLCFLQIDAAGERSFFSYRTETAEVRFGPDDIDETLIANAKVVHLCPTPMKLPAGRAAILHAAELAKSHGAMVSADCNLRPKHWSSMEDAASAGWDLARMSDILKLNEEEAQLIVGNLPPLDAARRLMEAGPKLVVVTLGSEGAVWVTHDDHGHVAAPRVDAVDATGCGDAWVAGLLARLNDTEDLQSDRVRDAIQEANRLGAAVATVYGATTPIETWPQRVGV